MQCSDRYGGAPPFVWVLEKWSERSNGTSFWNVAVYQERTMPLGTLSAVESEM